MPESVHLEIDVPGQPESVQAAAARGLQQHARDLGFGLAERRPGSLIYKPRLQFPFLLTVWPWLLRKARGEKLNLQFARGQQGTRVTITRQMSAKRAGHAADREQWSEALAGAVG
jgi:hypothetical protein